MKKFKVWLPYIFAVILFYILAYLFTPQVFSGKVVNQSDIASWRGMANEIIEYNQNHPNEDPALWTNSMFSGMPSTTISMKYEGDYTGVFYKFIQKVTGERPPAYLIISLLGAFMLFLAFGVDPWLSIGGAIAITFASYNMQIIQVGHNTKMVAIAYMPWVLAAVVYAYRQKPLLGATLFALALSFQIKANHPQITYYLAMMVLGYGFVELYYHIREKRVVRFLKTSVLLLIVGAMGIATNINNLWPTYEYSKYTMRGGSQLAQELGKDQKGLDLDYATSWSYSLQEIPNLFIPNFNGGTSVGELDKESATYKELKAGGYQGVDQIVKQLPLYWGGQPFTAGPMYIGAVSLFLFVLALILLTGAIKWWAIVLTLLSLLLSLGSNFLPLTQFFFKYAPLYNKFRTVSMVLVILQIVIPLLGILVINKLPHDNRQFKRGLIQALSVTGGFIILFLAIPSLAGSFTSRADGSLPEHIRIALMEDRVSLLRADALRSLLFILATATVLWYSVTKPERRVFVYGVISLLILVDMWSVGKRYLNDSHFVKRGEFEQQYALRPVDDEILKDDDINYRVLDLSVNTFNDSHVSYHHKTIGGYSPAKLQRYQDIIDYHLMTEIQDIAVSLNSVRTIEEAQIGFDQLNTPVLNMLNSKYIVIGASNPPLVNNNRLGNCWFVDSLIWVTTNLDEINLLSEVDLSKTAIVSNEFKEDALTKATYDSPAYTDEINLVDYSPNRLVYEVNNSSDRVALFSEVWYPAGWTAKIDGEPAALFRANYILRALKVPAGTQLIELEYKPISYFKGALYSRFASGALLILLVLGLSVEIVSRSKKG